MSERPWMPFYVGDYLKDTGHLTAEEHGAYLLLIMRYWEDGRLPSDERLIARYSRLTPEQWEASRNTLAAFFEDGWRHKRIDYEIAKAEDIMAKRSNSARIGQSKRAAGAVQTDGKSPDTRVPPSPSPEHSSLRSDVSGRAKLTARSELEAVLDGARASAVVEHRKLIGKPLTRHAAKLLADKFRRCTDPDAAADAMISNGWQGFEPEWLDRNLTRGASGGTILQADVFATLAEAGHEH